MLALLLGLACALVLAEAAFRALDVRAVWWPSKRILFPHARGLVYYCYPSNPHDELMPVPDVATGRWHLQKLISNPADLPLSKLAETPWCVEMRESPQGLRDRYYGPRAAGALRIMGLGDSFAAGEGVPLERTMFKRMEAQLGPGYEVVNAAKSGFYASDEVNRLRELEPLDCQRAIVVWILNDIHPSAALQASHSGLNDLINLRQDDLAGICETIEGRLHSRLLSVAVQRGFMALATNSTYRWYRECYSDENAENVRELEKQIQALARPEGVKVAFVLFPLLEGLESEYPFLSIHQRVAKMARDAGLPVLDLEPTFRGRRSEDLWVHPIDHHPNGKAHEIAATAMLEWLKTSEPDFLKPPAE